ncbi:hypothetical protein PTRA_a1993 [Pseudoalteromonas translucida KMM 520]|uniref:Uncharacterized protein n=1 Tax=Pseudoalteromonas translucida KMM 520 TaxID=1315283 RepID=A0A0U2WDM0_9GAMM|nr:hypothetical protein PTRA_a1993 [Pseudoalteromonas translucida KMM 520]
MQSQFSTHEIELIDALDYLLEPVFKPHFAYPKSKDPSQRNAPKKTKFN